MEFRLLGAVCAQADGRPVSLGPRQQRLIFAVLAWEVGRPVAIDRLVELIWPQSPPRTAQHAVRASVSRLRPIIAGYAELVTQGSAYVLRTDTQRIDAHRFQALVAQARVETNDNRRVELLDEALDLWRGPAVADAAPDEVRERLFGGLQETRLVAAEDRFDALLRLGRHFSVVSELTAAVAAHPTRERLVGQLMLALHRGGQTTHALDVARRTRAHLAEELGIDPGHDLRQLELAILRDDPAVAVPRPLGPPPPKPAQLPPDIADFTGREDMVEQLDALVVGNAAAVVINAIAGTAGVGKTALAVHWAHRVRDRFPDGQLHVNLRGYALGPPVRPAQALTQFLRAVGVPAEDVPADVDEAGAMYRTLLADKRMLILLDNAVSPGQVRPLLPASPGCVVLVTSRDRLDGLVAMDAARRMTLDVLPMPEAVALLRQMLGDRIDFEPAAAAELSSVCACLPLALRIAAAHLAGQPGRRIADQVKALRMGSPLASLQIEGDEQSAVAAAFDLSYAALEPDAQRLFRLLGLMPGADVDALAGAALAGLELPEAVRLLDRLAAAHLIDQHTPGRYTFHDLLRRYAWERAHDQDSPADRTVAVGQLRSYYLRTTRAAVDLLYPYMLRLEGESAPVFTDHADALAWLDSERANLVSTIHEANNRTAWQLADAIRTYLYIRGHNADLFAVARTALAAASGVPKAQAAAQLGIATAFYSKNQYPEAVSHYTTALELCRATGWVLGEAAMLNNLGVIAEQQGDLDAANSLYLESLELHEQAGMRHHEGPALMKIGSNRQYRGRFEEAAEYYARALASSQSLGSRHGEANALHYLGAVEFLLGRYEEAVEHNSRALAIYLDLGGRNDEAQARSHIARIHRVYQRYSESLTEARAALALALDTGEKRTETWVRITLGATHHAMGDERAAVADYSRALAVAREIGARYEECEALVGLAESRRSKADASEALRLAEEKGYRHLEKLSRALLS
ncbi:MAG: BTAD domain-containing putative transcriptional regulator [Kibdelosporangium sp.]